MHWHWSILISCMLACARMDRHSCATLCPHHHHQVPSCPRWPGSFRGDLAVFVGPSGWPRCCGCTRRCRRRHGMCPPPTPPLALSSRADGGRNGICRVSAPQRTAPEDGKGRARGTRSTTRPRSGSASPPGGWPAPLPGFCGMPWSILPTLHRWCKNSMLLCRRWSISCRTLSNSFVRSHLTLSRLSKCPGSCLMMSPCAPLCAIRSWRNSWWKCRRSCPFSSLQRTMFLVVEGEFLVFQVFPLERVLQRCILPRERISERVVVQIVDIPGGGLQDFRPGQISSSSSHVPAGVHEDADEPGQWFFFSHFSPT